MAEALTNDGVRVFGLIGAGVQVATNQPTRAKGEGLTVIIPAAGLGRRMRTVGSKALVELRPGETVLSRQVAMLRRVLPFADVIVVVGYEADRVYRALPQWVRVVENEAYETTNVVRSIDLGIRAAVTDRVLVIYGDLVFNEAVLRNFPLQESAALVDHSAVGRENEVGVTVVDDYVTQFAFGLDSKWAHIIYLSGLELHNFKRFSADVDKRRCFGFEALNEVLERGGNLAAVPLEGGMRLAEIDTSRDIAAATSIR